MFLVAGSMQKEDFWHYRHRSEGDEYERDEYEREHRADKTGV